MQDNSKEYNEKEASISSNKAGNYANQPNETATGIPVNEGSESAKDTTGIGYSQAERDGVDPRNPVIEHKGSEELAKRYNIDEQARLDSSVDDFYKTTSNFRHSDGSVKQNDEEL